MENNSLSKLGGLCSILIGVLNILIIPIGLLLISPNAEIPIDPNNPATLFPVVAQNPAPFVLSGLVFGLVGIFAFAAVPAISEIVRSANEGWVRWTSNLAYLGFAVSAVSSFQNVAVLPVIAATYVAGDAVTQAAIIAQYTPVSSSTLDSLGVLQFGGVGLWILVVSILALRRSLLPRGLIYAGIALGSVYWIHVIGEILKNSMPGVGEVLIGIGGGLGTLGALIWYVWIGLRLQRAGS